MLQVITSQGRGPGSKSQLRIMHLYSFTIHSGRDQTLQETLRKQQSVMEVTDAAEYVPNVTFIRSTIRSHHTIQPNVRHNIAPIVTVPLWPHK